MSSNKHTLGPWCLTESDTTIHILSSQRRGVYIGEIKKLQSDFVVEQRANAQLISAAPELLEALEEVAKYWVPTLSNYEDRAFFESIGRIQNAIDKAKGVSK